MGIELPQLQIKDESDILYLHDTTTQIGAWAGLSISERIRFAATVAENSQGSNNERIEVSFHIIEKDHWFFLQALMKNQNSQVEREALQKIKTDQLPPFQSSTPPTKNLRDDNKDLTQFAFALAHDLKNSITKLKLALSLIGDEEVPPAIDSYIQIIHRATERVETITLKLNRILQDGNHYPDERGKSGE